MYEEDIVMWVLGVLAVIGIVVSAVIGLNTDYCTGVEPDGDRETIVCPADWYPNEVRQIREDEYEAYED